jgi:hypothetical protein
MQRNDTIGRTYHLSAGERVETIGIIAWLAVKHLQRDAVAVFAPDPTGAFRSALENGTPECTDAASEPLSFGRPQSKACAGW